MAFVTPVVEHWLEREIAQWVHHEGSIRRPIERKEGVHPSHSTCNIQVHALCELMGTDAYTHTGIILLLRF